MHSPDDERPVPDRPSAAALYVTILFVAIAVLFGGEASHSAVPEADRELAAHGAPGFPQVGSAPGTLLVKDGGPAAPFLAAERAHFNPSLRAHHKPAAERADPLPPLFERFSYRTTGPPSLNG